MNYFETKIIDCGKNKAIRIGLYPHYSIMNRAELKYIRYYCENGRVYEYNGVNKYDHSISNYGVIENGDTIGCGIKFAMNNESSDDIVVYFKRNNIKICEINMKINEIGLYPTIISWSRGAKIEPKIL
jgi:hypothetical protein